MLQVSDAQGQLTLAGELDIYSVRDLRAQLDRSTRVDLSGVETLDGAGVQLLAWWRAADERRRVVNPSLAARTACAALGLERLLEAP